MKTCPSCEEEEIEDDDYACFCCAYELMNDTERENLS